MAHRMTRTTFAHRLTQALTQPLARTFATALATALAGAPLLLAPAPAHAQAVCASDGQPRPVALVERFISADCADCWADAATPRAGARELAIDWVLPGRQGEDAPLSTVALRDGLYRLQALGRAAPPAADSLRTPVATGPASPARRLRVAHGLPFNGYLGTSIELRPAGGGPWSAWLLLVETLPAGTEGSPVARNLVRNALQPAWDGPPAGSAPAATPAAVPRRLFESRPMGIPPGANPQRLRLVGWVQDGQGRIRAIAQSQCASAAPGG